MNNNKTQSGSVVAYAITAVVLLALLAGSFYLAKHWANNPSGQTANNPVEPTKQPATNKPTSNQSKPQSSSNKNQHKQQYGAANQSDSGSSESSGSSSQPSGSIAPAGPTDVIQTVVGLSILTGSAVAYRRSRHSLKNA